MTDPGVLLLLAVRLRGRGTAAAVRATFVLLGGDDGGFAGLLADAESLEQVRVRGQEERRSLTGAGEAELAAHLALETDRVGRADLVTAYEAFLPHNRALLAVLSQSPSPELLGELVDRLGPVLRALVERLARFGSYEDRFADALAKAAIDPAWMTSPSVDSVHTVWFELHEHLLATLGRSRVDER